MTVTVTIIIMIASFLAAPVVMLLIFWRLFRKTQPPVATVATTVPTTPKRRSPWRWLGLIPLAGVSLFIGLMIASVGGALHPPLLNIAAPLACDGRLEIISTKYSYKPGQHGVAHQTICVDPATGERKNVQFAVLGWATLIFSGIVFVPLLVLSLLLLKLLRRAFRGAGANDGLAADIKQTLQQRSHRVPDNGSVEDRLRELKRLLDHRLIDETDYSARKTEILSRL